MVKTWFFCFVGVVFCFGHTAVVLSQPNPALLTDLNKARRVEWRTLQACVRHQEDFLLRIPYYDMIREKEQSVEELTDLIIALQGQPGQMGEETVVIAADALQAVLADARATVALFDVYETLLLSYGHPDVRVVVGRARQRTLRHFMLLTNRGQELLAARTVAAP